MMKSDFLFLCAVHLLLQLVLAKPFTLESSLLSKRATQKGAPCQHDPHIEGTAPVKGTWLPIGECPIKKVSIDLDYPVGEPSSNLRCCVPASCSPPYNAIQYQQSYCSNTRACHGNSMIATGQCFNVYQGTVPNSNNANSGCCVIKTDTSAAKEIDLENIDPRAHRGIPSWESFFNWLGGQGDDLLQWITPPEPAPQLDNKSSSVAPDSNPVASAPETPPDTSLNSATLGLSGDSSYIGATAMNGDANLGGMALLGNGDLFSGATQVASVPDYSSPLNLGTTFGQTSGGGDEVPV